MDSSNWAMLPKHLLDSVLERLPSRLDYLRFSVVCMSWNSVVEDNLSKHTAPMLLAYCGKQDTWNLCDIARDKVLDLQLDLPKRRFCGFSKGWLISVDENFIVSLINPFSRVQGKRAKENSIIGLPALNHIETSRKSFSELSDCYVLKATISANPISNAKDCIVVIIHDHACQLAFIRLNKDTRWTYINARIYNIYEVVYVEDKFYAIDYQNQLFCFKVTTEQFNSDDIILVAEALEEPVWFFKKKYLVESNKELLMVHRFLHYSRRRRRSTMKFEVFKFDTNNHKWTEINTLGDTALFVGDNSSISVSASDFGCLPNCIYFIHDWDRVAPRPRHRDSGVYNITTQSFSSLGHASTLIKMSNRTPIWTMANFKL